MAMITLRQLLDHAAENGYAVPAFNINNMEQIRAIMLAALLVPARAATSARAGGPPAAVRSRSRAR